MNNSMRRHNQLETNNHTIVVDTERLNCANDDGVCLLLNDTRSSQQQRSRQQRRRRQLQQCLLNQWWILGIGLLLLYQNVLWSSAVSSSSSSSGEENWETFSRDYQDRFQRIPPSGLDQWFKFAKHKQCETQKYYNVIDEQLRVFRDNNDKLSLNDVIQEALTYNELHNAFEVKQNKLSLFQIKEKENGDHNKPWLLAKIDRYNKECTKRWLLQPLVKHQPPLSTRFVWNIMDEPTVNPKVPIFSACNEDLQLDDDNDYEMNRTVVTTTKTSNDDTATTLAVVKDLLIPYHFSIGFLARGLWFWPFFSHGKPWRDRTNTIIWRGSTTGDWGTGPRFRLLEQYNNNNGNNGKVLVFPSGVTADFAFSKVVQSKGRQLDAKYRLADRMSYRDMQKHKYVLDVDGNSFTERFPKLLRSGTLVFKSTKYREWFSERLEPWVHYIPVKYDLTDLADKVAWADAHPDRVEEIVENGRQSVERHLRPEDQQCYTYRLLLEYHALFNDTVN